MLVRHIRYSVSTGSCTPCSRCRVVAVHQVGLSQLESCYSCYSVCMSASIMIVTADAIQMHFYSWETSIPSARSADKTNLYRVNQKWPDFRFTVLLFLRSIATIVTHTCSLFVTTLSVWINCGNKSCSLFQPRQSTRITSWRKFLYRLQVKTRAAGALWGRGVDIKWLWV